MLNTTVWSRGGASPCPILRYASPCGANKHAAKANEADRISKEQRHRYRPKAIDACLKKGKSEVVGGIGDMVGRNFVDGTMQCERWVQWKKVLLHENK